jgi:hypothetical protein
LIANEAARLKHLDQDGPLLGNLEIETAAALKAVPEKNGSHDESSAPSSPIETSVLPGHEPPAARLSVKDLAEKNGISKVDALRKRLRRWQTDHDGSYFELTNRKPSDPRYLYVESAVQPIIDEMLDREKTSAKRPSKK